MICIVLLFYVFGLVMERRERERERRRREGVRERASKIEGDACAHAGFKGAAQNNNCDYFKWNRTGAIIDWQDND